VNKKKACGGERGDHTMTKDINISETLISVSGLGGHVLICVLIYKILRPYIEYARQAARVVICDRRLAA